jgi:ABC-type glycerol-3-phosphate transport system substrate-binding protein
MMKYIAVVCLFLLACTKEEKTTVTFWHVMGGPLGKRLDEMIADFNKLHPEATVKSVHMGSYDALAQKLMGAVASQTPPVIAQMYESWTDQFYKAGVLYPLEEFLKNDTLFDVEDFFPVFIEDNTYDSVLVTLPFNKSVPVFYYNRDLLRAHGIERFPADWIEFRDACELVKSRGVWATSWPIDVWYFSTMLYQNGGQLIDSDSRTPAFNDPQGVEVLEYMVQLVRDSLFYLNPGFQRQVEFLSERVAMIPASVVSWAFIKDRPPFDMGVAPFPHGRYRATVIAGTNIGMFRNVTEEQRIVAWKFIKWFLEPENQIRWTEATYYLPTRKSTTYLESFQRFVEDNPGYAQIVDQLYVAKTEPRTKEWFAGRIYLNQALEEAVRLERTPQEALNIAADRLRTDVY